MPPRVRSRVRVGVDGMACVTDMVGAGRHYDAIQYIQSYIARKGDSLSSEDATALVLRAAQLIVDAGESACATELCVWFIKSQIERATFTLEGAQKLLEFAITAPATTCAEICLTLEPHTLGDLASRVHLAIGQALLTEKQFSQACRWLSKAGQMDKYANGIHTWSLEGYPSEKYLFSARAVLLALASEGQAGSTAGLLRDQLALIDGWSTTYPVCRLCELLIDLLEVEPPLNVSRTEVFMEIAQRFGPYLMTVDKHLAEMLKSVGQTRFGVPKSGGLDALSSALTSSNPNSNPAGLIGNFMRALSSGR